MIKPLMTESVKGEKDSKTKADNPWMKIDIPKAVFAAILSLFINHASMTAQQAQEARWDYADLAVWAYGQDQELVNGLQYYDRHPKALGHPYLLEGWVHEGSVNIRGKIYSDLWLKYDIFTQQVEVEYRTMNGADNQVILVSDRVKNFSIGNYHFESLTLEEDLNQASFYQVVGDGPVVLYIYWYKNLVPTSGDPRFIEEFTSAKRKYFLVMNGAVHPFNNKKSFVKLFPDRLQKEIKRLAKSNQVVFRTASPEQLELFTLAAGKLVESTE
jgi:hypothetical protein